MINRGISRVRIDLRYLKSWAELETYQKLGLTRGILRSKVSQDFNESNVFPRLDQLRHLKTLTIMRIFQD